MDETNRADLAAVAEKLDRIDRTLAALAAEVRSRAGALREETAEALLDRLDEMMDLLYLVDERLSAILETPGDQA